MTTKEIRLYRKKWNVPDWKNAGAYPKLRELNMVLWRWEFLRRRADYRNDWEVWSLKTYERELQYREYLLNCKDEAAKDLLKTYNCILKPDAPQFRATMDGPLKYGLVGLPNPALRDPHKYGPHVLPSLGAHMARWFSGKEANSYLGKRYHYLSMCQRERSL